MKHLFWGATLVAVLFWSCSGMKAQSDLSFHSTLTTTGSNAHYLSNREPLLQTPLTKLPLGSVQAQGWLHTQLLLMSDGFTGRLPELSKFCAFDNNAWTTLDGSGEHGWEEVPYWLKGFQNLGYLLQDQRIIDESNRWVQAVLKSQQSDGYFGSAANRESTDLWPNMAMLFVLRSYYEATEDPAVIEFMTRYFRWQMTIPFENFLPSSWQKWRGGDNLDSIYWLYNITGEAWLLDLARINHERTADWSGTIPTWHGVNLCQGFREPGQYYQQAQDVRYLQAADRNYHEFMGLYGQVPGGMFGADENCRIGYYGPRQAAETCSMAELMFSCELLTAITGKTVWADRCEEIAFNNLPASMTPDLKALHYLTAPNQIQLDRENKAPLIQNPGDMFSYTPWRYRCCQHNVAFAWPYFTEYLWMATDDNGLAAVLFAPSTVVATVADGKKVTIEEKTNYPFDDTIEFAVSLSGSASFPLVLRIPGWCRQPRLSINGSEEEIDLQPDGWLKIRRRWHNGDRIQLHLPAEFEVKTWEKNKNGVSIHRGPLVFSLKIQEEWRRYGDSEEWPGYEVFPASAWNYGLIVDPANPNASLTLARKADELADQPFALANAPLTVTASAKKIPGWQQEENGMVGALQKSPVRSDQPIETVELVPAGCARLRITHFPAIGSGSDAMEWNDWVTPQATTSHHYGEDALTALYDDIVPKRSNDSRVPRLTFWDHRGTSEWVKYSFRKPQTLTGCRVFWYDDEGRGLTRIPKSWRIEYLYNGAWRPVQIKDDYTVLKNQFNAVHFQPVKTTAVRLVIDLQKNYTAGILEWQIDRI
ncbi:glycoside hydrolase family 127 protein [candidate division KSB1 bacterium]|nr:glycoside hydrolase family 127 protein [candidate division KSB1 bacterium]